MLLIPVHGLHLFWCGMDGKKRKKFAFILKSLYFSNAALKHACLFESLYCTQL